MREMRAVMTGLLFFVAQEAHAQSFEQQVQQISQQLSGAALQTRQAMAASQKKAGNVSRESTAASSSSFSPVAFIRIITTGWSRDYDSSSQAQEALRAVINNEIDPELYIQFRSGWDRDFDWHSQAMEAAEAARQGKISQDLYITLRSGWARDFDAHSQAMEAAEAAILGVIDTTCYISGRAAGIRHYSAMELCAGPRGH